MQTAHPYLALGAEAANITTHTSMPSFTNPNNSNNPLINNNNNNNNNFEACDKSASGSRRRRQLVPTEQKDDTYWSKRKKNNEAARRSREKRRANDMMLERRLTEMQKENASLKAQLYALQLRYGEVGFMQNNPNINNQPINQSINPINLQHDQIAHQHAHTQAMAAAASAAAAAYHIKKEAAVSSVPPEAKKPKMIPEVILPDGRKMLLDTSDSDSDKNIEKKNNASNKNLLQSEALKNLQKHLSNPDQPVRMSSPSPSESSSTPIIVDEEDHMVDVVGNCSEKKVNVMGSSGVSSDNESNTNSNTTKSSVTSPPEKDAAAQLAAAQAAAQASGLVPITVTNNGQSSVQPVTNQENSNVTEQLTEYYKQQFAAIYAQQQAQVASGQTTLANAQNLLPTLQGTTTAATQLAINLLKNSQNVNKM